MESNYPAVGFLLEITSTVQLASPTGVVRCWPTMDLSPRTIAKARKLNDDLAASEALAATVLDPGSLHFLTLLREFLKTGRSGFKCHGLSEFRRLSI